MPAPQVQQVCRLCPKVACRTPLSSKSIVPTLRRLRRRLSTCGARQTAPLHTCHGAAHLRIHCMDAAVVYCHCHFSYCHFSSLQLTGSLLLRDFKSPTVTLKYSVSNRLQQLARCGRRPSAEDRPTTRPSSQSLHDHPTAVAALIKSSDSKPANSAVIKIVSYCRTAV